MKAKNLNAEVAETQREGRKYDQGLIDLWINCWATTNTLKDAYRRFIMIWSSGVSVGFRWPATDPVTGVPKGCSYCALAGIANAAASLGRRGRK